MKEIGGYFGLEQLIKKELYSNLISLNTARNALLYLIKAKKINKIFIPYYLCNSVSDVLISNKIDFEYYNIDAMFNPIFEKELKENEYLYIVNYFGQINNKKISSLKHKHRRIIIDNTQAFFQTPIKGIDTIYSCRKFFGVPDGAYLSTKSRISEELSTDVSKDRMTHILGRFEGLASDYYKSFQENDKTFSGLPLMNMSKLTKNILGAIDYGEIAKTRNENYSFLERDLLKMNRLKLIGGEGAFAYPFYIKNGIDIRKKLAEQKIYIPTLWPNVLGENKATSIEYDYAANILPLPCDQRYELEDMEKIIKEVR